MADISQQRSGTSSPKYRVIGKIPLSFELNHHQISMNHITKAYLGFPGITNPECPLGSSAIAIDYDFKTKKVLLAYNKKKSLVLNTK